MHPAPKAECTIATHPAPEAQWLLAPRFSVGKTVPDHPASPVGTTEICARRRQPAWNVFTW